MKKTILIVDDKEMNLYIYKRYLSSLLPWCDVLSATSGTEALEIFKLNKIDLLITDIHMPGMNGFDLIEKARHSTADDHFQFDPTRLKIIILSAGIDNDPRVKLSDEQIIIPINREELMAAVKKYATDKTPEQ